MLEELKGRISAKQSQIAVVGFGYIGTCMGAVLADRGYNVVGIDVRKNIVDEINKGKTSIAEPNLPELIQFVTSNGRLKATADFSVIKNCDIIIVTVGTPLGENFSPNTQDITMAFESMAPHFKKNHVIILKSTVPPGTTDKVVVELIKKSGLSPDQYFLSFCPERLAEGRAIEEFKTIPVVVGGVNAQSSDIAAYFWQNSMDLETIIVDNAVAAEMIKLADNLWIDLNVSLANEIAMISQRLGIDALQVISAANTLPKGKHHVNILHPSIGVGGYCLTKDPWFVHHLGKTLGFNLKTPVASREVNDSMPNYSFKLIDSAIKKMNKNWKDIKVAVLGVSFKNNTGDCRFTPTQPIIAQLEKTGCRLSIFDPWVSDHDAKTVTQVEFEKNISNALKDADCILFFTGHDEFQKLSILDLKEYAKPGAYILDGRNFFPKYKIIEAQKAGFTYQGIGRY